MSPLSPKARAIIGAGREGLQPAPGDRERLEALLDSRLAAGAAGSAASGLLATGVKAWHIGLAAALVGGSAALAVRWQDDDAAPRVTVAQAPVASVQASPAPPSVPSAVAVTALDALPSSPVEPVSAAPRARGCAALAGNQRAARRTLD